MTSSSTPPTGGPAGPSLDVTLNERYRLRSWLRRSVMADEFLADDLLLNRVVVFKALLPELVSDKGFIDRFRTQAQAGANLSHPAISAVLDWGRDPGPIPDGTGGTRPGPTYYLVSEQPEGRSLRQLVEANGAMPFDRAAHVLIATSAALAHAHRNGVVHGGLNPDCIRVSPSGIVKVLDIGLAASLGNTWSPAPTQTEAAMWTAPEQFDGKGSSEHTDVYQLGLLAYYLATGRPPYTGDTTEVIRDRHLRQVPLAPTKVNAKIPKAFETFIGRSMAKVPSDRFATVAEQRSAMIRVRDRVTGQAIAASTPPPATGIASSAPATAPAAGEPARATTGAAAPGAAAPGEMSGPDATVIMAAGTANPTTGPARNPTGEATTTTAMTRPAATTAAETSTPTSPTPTSPTPTSDDTMVQRPDRSAGAARNGAINGDAALPSGPQDDFASLDDGGRRWPYFVALVVLLAILAGLLGLLARQLGFTGDDTTKSVVVPSVESRPLNEADAALKDKGLRVEVERQPSSDFAADVVIKQTPAAGAKVAEGQLVTLQVSTGSTKPTVPDLVGMTSDQAKSVLASYGMSIAIREKKDDSVDQGIIVSQEPRANNEVAPGATITVDVAVSSGTKAVPDLSKKTVDEARVALTKDGFLIVVQSEASNDVDKGLVIRTEPAGGTNVAKGSSVVIFVSGGKEITVPDVIGKDQDSAVTALQSIGFIVSKKARVESDPSKDGKVVSQTPAAGQNLELGGTVFIRVGILDSATTTAASATASTDAPAPAPVPLQTVATPATTAPPSTQPVVTVVVVPSPEPAPAPASTPAPGPVPVANPTPAPAPGPSPVPAAG